MLNRFITGIEYRPIIAEVKGFITCILCNGYLIDATTITGCLHTCKYFQCKKKPEESNMASVDLNQTFPCCSLSELHHQALGREAFLPQMQHVSPTREWRLHRQGHPVSSHWHSFLRVRPTQRGKVSQVTFGTFCRSDNTVQTLVYKLVPGLYKSENERRLKAIKDLKTHVEPVQLSLVSPDDTIHISIEYCRWDLVTLFAVSYLTINFINFHFMRDWLDACLILYSS